VLRFHLASGVRLAQVAFAPLAGAMVVAIGLSQDPAATLKALAAAVAAPRLAPSTLAALLGVGAAIAAWASPRLAFSTSGWIRHLPASAVGHRRAAALALAAAQLPLLAVGALLTAVALAAHAPVAPTRIPALALAALALGSALAPSPRKAAALALGLAAAVAALALGAVGLVAAALLVAVSDRLGGAPAAKPLPLRASRFSRWPLPLPEAIAVRVVAPALSSAYALAVVPLGAAYALAVNNPELPPLLAARGARLGGVLAVAIVVARACDRLALQRPPWPWARSLPWSSQRRILADATVLAAVSLPAAIASAWLHGPSAAAVAAAATPVLALRGAGSLRRPADAPPPAGAVLGEGAFVAAVLALRPWLAVAALAAAPWALAAAARRERELRVSRWAALHHLAAGDPLSWRTR
jgi:hypothetical protein